MAFPFQSQHILQILAHLNFPGLRSILDRGGGRALGKKFTKYVLIVMHGKV